MNYIEKYYGKAVKALVEPNAVYAAIPPVTALLESKTSEKVCVVHPELAWKFFIA